MHMLFRRNFQRHGFQTNIYACGVDLFNKPSGILGAGEFFLKIVKAKAIVDTFVNLIEDTSRPQSVAMKAFKKMLLAPEEE